MSFINGYKFSTEAEADAAQNNCNVYYGIPAEPEDTTQNWTGYWAATLNNPIFWYIVYDESLVPVLGQPEQIEIVTNI